MSNPVIPLLTKICARTPGSRTRFPTSLTSLMKLDKYCIRIDMLMGSDFPNVMKNIPCYVSFLHLWTEALLRIHVLYDQRDNNAREAYLCRIQRYVEFMWIMFRESTNRSDKSNFTYMYATIEMFIFQIKWKRFGLHPSFLVPSVKPILDMLRENIPEQLNLDLSYPYAKDFILSESFEFFG